MNTIVSMWNDWRSQNPSELIHLSYADLRGADLRDADLSGAYLSGADLRGADLRDEDLRGAYLSGADLRGANLRGANLRGANLRDADLSGADLRGANLRGANLRDANLSGADLSDANLSFANLSFANLSSSNLRDANLRYADLRGADLRDADLSGADLSGCTGLLSASEWLLRNFQTDTDGVLVYKAFRGTTFEQPDSWLGGAGTVCEERGVNPDRCTECGSGVNFGTRKFCENNYHDSELWLCRIAWIDLADVVVPFNTDGKARCARLTKLERVK